MTAIPAPRPSTIRMEKHLRDVMARVKGKIATVSGDSAMIRLDPKQTRMAIEAYDEHALGGPDDESNESEVCDDDEEDPGRSS